MTRFGPLVALIALVAAGCGGASHSSKALAGATPSSAGSALVPSTSAAVPTTGGPKSAGPTVTGQTPPGQAPRSGPPAAAAPPVAGPPNQPGHGPAPATPGTYRYRQSGSTTVGTSAQPIPPEGTLQIDRAGTDGTQVSHRAVDPNGPPSDSTFAFRNGGIFLTQTVLRTNAGGQQTTFTCTFNPPLPTPPWPPTVGATFQGHGDCGKFTVDVAGRVTGQRDVPLDNVSHHVYVVSSTLTFHGQLEGSGTQTDWFEPASRLTLHEEATQNGKYGGVVSFASHSVSDLLSEHPQ